MKLADLHCDTASRLYSGGFSLADNGCHISLKKSSGYEKYVQLTAVFTDTSLSDAEGYERFFAVADNLKAEAAKNGVPFAYSGRELAELCDGGSRTVFVLTVEDARIIGAYGTGDKDAEKAIDKLYDAGVRVITPLWGGLTCIGGSHDTDAGLTDFGKKSVRYMCERGIIPDISHASFKSSDDIMDIAEELHSPVVATHMNSYTVCRHTRNLTDERFRRLVSLGGIAGVSLCVSHLSADADKCTVHDAAKHILHYISVCGENSVCMGCDYDGTDTPPELTDVSKLTVLRDVLLESGVGETVCDKIFYENAYSFLIKNL